MIRKYRDEDVSVVLRIWVDASVVGHPFLSKEFLTAERENVARVYLPNAETWVWEEGGRVGGFLSLIHNEVGGLFVDPALHGRGIGRSLVDHARNLRGELEVEVFKANSPGLAFYASCGFIEIGEGVHAETGLDIVRLKLA